MVFMFNMVVVENMLRIIITVIMIFVIILIFFNR